MALVELKLSMKSMFFDQDASLSGQGTPAQGAEKKGCVGFQQSFRNLKIVDVSKLEKTRQFFSVLESQTASLGVKIQGSFS